MVPRTEAVREDQAMAEVAAAHRTAEVRLIESPDLFRCFPIGSIEREHLSLLNWVEQAFGLLIECFVS